MKARKRPSNNSKIEEPSSTKNPLKDLKEGDPIPGSRMIRAFCTGCGLPMRVEILFIENYCNCSNKPPARGTRLTPRQQHGSGATDS